MFTDIVLISAIISITTLLIIGILVKSGMFSALEVSRKRLKLQKDYSLELEQEIAEYKRALRSEQTRRAARETPPTLRGDLSDIGTLIPELLPMIGNKLPGWFRPIINNPQAIGMVQEFAQRDPEKFTALISKIINVKPKDSSSDKANIEGNEDAL